MRRCSFVGGETHQDLGDIGRRRGGGDRAAAGRGDRGTHREKASAWMDKQDRAWRDQIRWGTLDMSGPYRKVFNNSLPERSRSRIRSM